MENKHSMRLVLDVEFTVLLLSFDMDFMLHGVDLEHKRGSTRTELVGNMLGIIESMLEACMLHNE